MPPYILYQSLLTKARDRYTKHELNHDVKCKYGEWPVRNPEAARDRSPVSIVTAPTVRKSVGCVLTTSPHTFSDWYVDRCEEDTKNRLAADNLQLKQRGNNMLPHCERDA